MVNRRVGVEVDYQEGKRLKTKRVGGLASAGTKVNLQKGWRMILRWRGGGCECAKGVHIA